MKDWDVVLILRRVGHFYGDWCYPRTRPYVWDINVLSEVRNVVASKDKPNTV